jgi:nucleoside-diphosphate-sugar epimerase
MARVLLVGCGCRGRELTAVLRADGHAVRGTTRGAHVEEIRAAGMEPGYGSPVGAHDTTVVVDDLVEAFELSDRRWVVGVQWHPERTTEVSPEARRIFDAFVAEAARTTTSAA